MVKKEGNKMGWKNWPYWLKGGIIGFVISFILHVIYHFNGLRYNTIADCYPGPCYNKTFFEAVFYNPTFYIIIIIGLLIGFIYGIIKFKMRKR